MHRLSGLRISLRSLSLLCAFVSPILQASDKITLAIDGKAVSKIVVSSQATDEDKKAAEVLCKYLKRISGAEFGVSDAGTNVQDSIIWLGSADPAPVPIDWKSLEGDGFCIKTFGHRLILAGGDHKGTLYAVYTFLEKYLGCRKYSPDVEFIPNRRSIVLDPIEDNEVPKIKFRMESFYEAAYADWHKLDTYKDEWGLFVHTFKLLVPPEKYFKDHPEYFSLTKGGRVPDAQLCLTNSDVFRIVVETLRERMKQNPAAKYWSVSQNDTFSPCECDSCRRLDNLAGSPSGSLLSFVNRVADEFPDKIISTLAYQYSRSAPKHIKPRPNVNIMLCSIECNRSKPLETDPTSASFVQDVRDWTQLTHNIFLWDYVIQFRNLVSPFPNFRVLQPNIQFFAKNGIISVFEQGLGNMHGEFAELRTYLIAKLLWNPNINVDSVMGDFLAGFYGQAAPYIRNYIEVMENSLRDSGEDLGIYGYPLPSEHGYLSPANIDSYNALFDRAEEVTRDDPAVYTRVQVARLPLLFAMLEQAKIYGTSDRGFYKMDKNSSWMVKPTMVALIDTFIVRCKHSGIERLWEHGASPDEYLASTRQFLESSMKKHLALFKRVVLDPPASPKYHDGEASALTDGLKGWDDYHMNWLGFEGDDMVATIDLGKLETIKAISSDFLQDINAWIFMPLNVEFSLSKDGRQFHTVGSIDNKISEHQEGAVVEPMEIQLSPQNARFIRLKAVNRKMCPGWHKGAGGLAWIFADEIVIE
jgi:hypothetical protein